MATYTEQWLEELNQPKQDNSYTAKWLKENNIAVQDNTSIRQQEILPLVKATPEDIRQDTLERAGANRSPGTISGPSNYVEAAQFQNEMDAANNRQRWYSDLRENANWRGEQLMNVVDAAATVAIPSIGANVISKGFRPAMKFIIPLALGLAGGEAVNQTTQLITNNDYENFGQVLAENTGTSERIASYFNPGYFLGGSSGLYLGKELGRGIPRMLYDNAGSVSQRYLGRPEWQRSIENFAYKLTPAKELSRIYPETYKRFAYDLYSQKNNLKNIDSQFGTGYAKAADKIFFDYKNSNLMPEFETKRLKNAYAKYEAKTTSGKNSKYIVDPFMVGDNLDMRSEHEILGHHLDYWANEKSGQNVFNVFTNPHNEYLVDLVFPKGGNFRTKRGNMSRGAMSNDVSSEEFEYIIKPTETRAHLIELKKQLIDANELNTIYDPITNEQLLKFIQNFKGGKGSGQIDKLVKYGDPEGLTKALNNLFDYNIPSYEDGSTWSNNLFYKQNKPKDLVTEEKSIKEGRSTKGTYKQGEAKKFANEMRQRYKSNGVTNDQLVDLLVAQDALESGWGSKVVGDHNYGNIIGTFGGAGNRLTTPEYIKGKWKKEHETFKAYTDPNAYVRDKVRMLKDSYDIDFDNDTIDTAISKLQGGNKLGKNYATSPTYSTKLKNQVRYVTKRYDDDYIPTAQQPYQQTEDVVNASKEIKPTITITPFLSEVNKWLGSQQQVTPTNNVVTTTTNQYNPFEDMMNFNPFQAIEPIVIPYLK